jgi:LPPG:FO 2-phospho-L-lactate transferase
VINIVALAGGVGGAKLADGLQQLTDVSLTVVVNTGDDFSLHGLTICPDLDTVMYTLAGLANPATGWGLAGDTFQALEMFTRYGADDWFRLGDRDLATHIVRTQSLREGSTLSDVTARLAKSLGVRANIVPMTNERVATMVESNQGLLAFQEYFVHRHCVPVVRSFFFDGIAQAQPCAEALMAIAQANMIIFCPSNPFVSIEPILLVHGMREALHAARAVKVAVSPIIGGEALKGPAAKMFRELGLESSAQAVALRYRELIDGFVLDQIDEAQAKFIRQQGMQVLVADTIMRSVAERGRLAQAIVAGCARDLLER